MPKIKKGSVKKQIKEVLCVQEKPEWHQSKSTKRWFLFGVGNVIKQDGWWVATLKKRMKPRTRKFPTRTSAMDWVEEVGGKPDFIFERK